jgi:hypothetical protein
VLGLARDEFADRWGTEGRFEAMLAELARDREEQTRKWEAQERKWEAQERKWEAQDRKWVAQEHKWQDQRSQWKRHQEEVWAEFRRLHEENRERDRRFERSIGALGSRWGLQSEQAFRDALAGILEESFGVQVINVNEYDDQGEVFGKPDQI